MPNTFSGPVEQGVRVGGNFTSTFQTPQRLVTLIPSVQLNNIRLLGLLDIARNLPTSEGLRLCILVSYEIRRPYQATNFTENFDIQPGDYWYFIPLYDFPLFDFRVGFP